MKTLLVTVDSLRHDHLEHMPKTESFILQTHDTAFPPSTAAIRRFLGLLDGEFVHGSGLMSTSVVNRFNEYPIGVPTDYLFSAEHGFDEGFDIFHSSKGGGDSIKDKATVHLHRGSLMYRVASWGWNQYQRFAGLIRDVEKSFRPVHDVIKDSNSAIADCEDWFEWLHFMEPHPPYDPDGGDLTRGDPQRLTRKVLAGDSNESEREQVREIYGLELIELDERLGPLWGSFPNDTRVVFYADQDEPLEEDGIWDNPGEMWPGPLRVPFGSRNAPDLDDAVPLVGGPSILLWNEYEGGRLDRNVAFAIYGDEKAAMNADNIATDDGVLAIDGSEPAEDPSLERSLSRFGPGPIVKEEAIGANMADRGYV